MDMNIFSFVLLSIVVALTGCSANNNNVPVHKTPPKDGTIVSMQLLKVSGQNPNINIYKLIYWSDGRKVEGYVTEPKNPGPNVFPLEVSCHGGWVTARTELKHDASPDTLGLIGQSLSNWVTFYPEYRGYADSEGTVSDIKDNVTDTENGIVAMESLKTVNGNFIFLSGASMGGDVVLMIAGDSAFQQAISSVVAVSPFVGWDTVEKWANQNKDTNDVARNWYVQGEAIYGDYQQNKQKYLENSPDINSINVPVLLLQGTGDKNVPWQTVQLFNQEMKQAGKNVTLDIIPGGNHGLGGQYASQKIKDINDWLKSLR